MYKIKKNRGKDLAFVCINSIILILLFVLIVYPLWFVISASVSSPAAVSTGKMLLIPVEPSLKAYKFILSYQILWTGYANTIFYTVFGTLVNLAATLPCAYALSRRDCPFRGLIMTLFMVTMYFGGGMIPSYLNINSMHLLNTRTVLLLVGAVSTYNLIVARTFFANTIPWELHEAAFLDGCSDFKLFTRIVLPLSSPIIVVLILYYGVGHWNGYFDAMIYIQDRTKYPLQIFLREILTQSRFADTALATGNYTPEAMDVLLKQAEQADMVKYAVIVVSTLPMMVVYPFLQKYFMQGVMIGSVKG